MSEQEEPINRPLSDPETVQGVEKWKRLLIVTSTFLALIAVVAIAIRLGLAIHHTLLLFSLGGLIAYALDPLVEFLRKPKFGKKQKSMSRTLCVFTVFIAMFLIGVGGLAWLGGQGANQVKHFQEDGPKYKERALGLAHDFDTQVLQPRNISFSVEQSIQTPPPEVNQAAERAGKEALPFVAHTATGVAESVIVLLIALYFLIFGTEMKEKVNKNLPDHLLKYALPWEKDVNRILGGFVRGQAILALLTGAIAAVCLLLIGVHLWLIIGLFVVAASLIPVIGPYIAAVPAIIAALVSPTHFTPVAGAIIVAVVFVIINEAGSKILYPKLVGQALNLHEVAVLFVLFAGIEIDGIIGALFAAPITALSIVTIVHLYRLWQDLPELALADQAASSGKSGPGKLFESSKPSQLPAE